MKFFKERNEICYRIENIYNKMRTAIFIFACLSALASSRILMENSPVTAISIIDEEVRSHFLMTEIVQHLEALSKDSTFECFWKQQNLQGDQPVLEFIIEQGQAFLNYMVLYSGYRRVVPYLLGNFLISLSQGAVVNIYQVSGLPATLICVEIS